MEKVIIFGGTGFIGQSLADFLTEKGIHPILVARTKPQKLQYEFCNWDGENQGKWNELLEGALAVVNLAGKTVDCIKTPDNCDLILRSRVDATKAIGKGISSTKNPPKVWVQMSTGHIYGDPPKVLCTEESSFGFGLAPIVGKAWEKAFRETKPEHIRGVLLRTSFVIGKNGGAFKTLKKIAKLGLGGKIASGQQGISWIHEEDMNRIIWEAIQNEKFQEAYISTAPNPVSQKDFMKTLRKKMKFPFGLPATKWMIQLGAKIFFRTDPDLLLYGRYLKSERLEKEGFTFTYPTLDLAIENLLKK